MALMRMIRDFMIAPNGYDSALYLKGQEIEVTNDLAIELELSHIAVPAEASAKDEKEALSALAEVQAKELADIAEFNAASAPAMLRGA